MHPDDHLVLEDESGRVKLGGAELLPSAYVTGLCTGKFVIVIYENLRMRGLQSVFSCFERATFSVVMNLASLLASFRKGGLVTVGRVYDVI